jgi:hypothetical protein
VIAVGDSCHTLSSVDVGETSGTVRVTAYSRDIGSNDGSGGCDDLMQMPHRRVQLEAPLGDRRLVGCDPDSDLRAFPPVGDKGCLTLYGAPQ